MLKKKNLIFLGAPGAGKGTISNVLIAKYGVAHISTGDILRAEVAQGTPAGQEAAVIMKAGKLVPDELVCSMVKNRLAEPDCEKGFILDGFPRTIPQADRLNAVLSELGKEIDYAIYLKVEDEVLLQRLTARLNCRGCDAIYNKLFMPPKTEGICDKCGSELFQRADDSLETAKNRLEVFYKQTQPLLDYYTEQGKVLAITELDKDKIVAAIEKELA